MLMEFTRLPYNIKLHCYEVERLQILFLDITQQSIDFFEGICEGSQSLKVALVCLLDDSVS